LGDLLEIRSFEDASAELEDSNAVDLGETGCGYNALDIVLCFQMQAVFWM
jgi:hypothetical protein